MHVDSKFLKFNVNVHNMYVHMGHTTLFVIHTIIAIEVRSFPLYSVHSP